MQYRSWMLAGLLTQAGAVQAMGLGELDLRSHLGSPLQAELALFAPGSFNRQDIQVRIARLDVYDRLGARYEPFHSNIEFDVREDAQGRIAIIAFSKKRVTEPFLDIVVELSWPAGTAYRRYNLLVDPPAYAARWQKPAGGTQPGAFGTAAAGPAAVESAAMALVRQPRPVRPAPATGSQPAGADVYVVQHGDSLWKIARGLRTESSQSLHALMQALYQANPDAFIQGDRNRLKQGAALRVPASLAPLQQLAQAAGSAGSMASTPAAPATRSAAQPAVRPVQTAAPEAALDIRAELASARQAQQSAVPDSLADIQAAIARLEQEKQELHAFQQRLKADMVQVLEQRVAATEALLQAEQAQRALLTGEEPAAQQAIAPTTPLPAAATAVASGQAASNHAASNQATTSQATTREATASEAATSQTSASATSQTTTSQATAPAEESAPPQTLASMPAPPSTPGMSDMRLRDLMAISSPETSTPDLGGSVAAHDLLGPTPRLTNSLIGNSGPSLWYLLAMVPLGLLVVLMGMRSHRVQQIRRTEQVKDEDLHEMVFGSRRDRNRVESPDQLRKALDQIREKADSHDKQRLNEPGAMDANEGRDDLKQMIELYLLYSQYQKALNVILTEITKRPGRADLRLYLMQVYAEMGDWKAFDEQEEVLRRLGQHQLLEQALQLRQNKKR